MLRCRRLFARWFALLSCGLFLSYGAFRANAATTVNLLLGWQDNSEDELGFRVQRAPTPTGRWITVGNTPANQPFFLDSNLKPSTAYYYRVRAAGRIGMSPFSNVAKVITPSRAMLPRIRTHPQRQTALFGGDATFSVTVGGNPPFNYQWRCNGTNLPGATAPTLNLKSVGAAQVGNYSLVISNNVGFATSVAAKLTVLAPLIWNTDAGGVIKPYASGQPLEIGRIYVAGAIPKSGNTFLSWRMNGTNVQAGRVLRFTMQPGLELSANFRDVTSPTVQVLSPRAGAQVSTAQVLLNGTVRDNMVVGEVWYQLNGESWLPAAGTTNWQAQVWLRPGANTIRVFARDTTGNCSRTNTLILTSLATNLIPVSQTFVTNSQTMTMQFQGTITPPVITEIQVGDSSAIISFQGIPGIVHQLEFKNSLADPEWIPLPATLVPGNDGPFQLIDTSAPQGCRFYRVRASSPH